MSCIECAKLKNKIFELEQILSNSDETIYELDQRIIKTINILQKIYNNIEKAEIKAEVYLLINNYDHFKKVSQQEI